MLGARVAHPSYAGMNFVSRRPGRHATILVAWLSANAWASPSPDPVATPFTQIVIENEQSTSRAGKQWELLQLHPDGAADRHTTSKVQTCEADRSEAGHYGLQLKAAELAEVAQLASDAIRAARLYELDQKVSAEVPAPPQSRGRGPTESGDSGAPDFSGIERLPGPPERADSRPLGPAHDSHHASEAHFAYEPDPGAAQTLGKQARGHRSSQGPKRRILRARRA